MQLSTGQDPAHPGRWPGSEHTTSVAPLSHSSNPFSTGYSTGRVAQAFLVIFYNNTKVLESISNKIHDIK